MIGAPLDMVALNVHTLNNCEVGFLLGFSAGQTLRKGGFH